MSSAHRDESPNPTVSTSEPGLTRDESAFLRGELPPVQYFSRAYDLAKIRAERYYQGSSRSWVEKEPYHNADEGSRWLPLLSSDSQAFLSGIISADRFLDDAHLRARKVAERDLLRRRHAVASVLSGLLATVIALVVTGLGTALLATSLGSSGVSALIAGLASLATTAIYIGRHSQVRRNRR